MTVGFYSPMPPARTGVADYSESLLSALRPVAEVKLNQPGDVCLYHLGNNPLHCDIYRLAVSRPGVVVMHDAVLNHFLLGVLDREQYVEEFVYNYGEWSRPLAETFWRDRARSGADRRYFEYPMLRRVVERSRAVIVHNLAAAAIVKKHGPGTPVYEIPHLLEPPRPVPGWRAERVRAGWTNGARKFVFGIFGHLRESKRIATCLRAFETVRGETACALVLSGDFVSADLQKALAPRIRCDGIIRTGYLPRESFWEAAYAVDACLNLRYPPSGETSGISIRLMGAGKAVIVTTGTETERFPENSCLRVDTGLAEEEMLVRYMQWLAREPGFAREIGRRAARHIAEQHSPAAVAGLYAGVLNAVWD